MNKDTLLNVLAYVNIGLGIAHEAGVRLGHFGSTDFVSLAQQVNNLLLGTLAPASAPAVASVQSTSIKAAA